MTGITSIKRDWGDAVTIVRIISSDTLSTISATNYILGQATNIAALNEGAFEWLPSDFVLVYSSAASGGGWGFFNISADFQSLIPFAFSSTVIGTPVVIGDFAIFQSTSGNLEDLGYSPSDAAKTKVVMANGASIINHIATYTDIAGTIGEDATIAINGGSIQAGLSGTAGTLISYPAAASNGNLIVAAVGNAGNFNATLSSVSTLGQSSVYTLPDPGAATANVIISSALGSQTVTFSSASATPGTVRSLIGKASLSNATYANTSNSVAGLRGEIDYVGISSGFLYGVQGKLIPTGTVAGSGWNAAVFGQFDISAATINAGQMATIWGDYGATSGTLTSQTGLYGIAMTNTTAAVLAGQLYLYGGAQNLLLLQTNAGLSGVTYFINSGTGSGSWGNATPPTPSKVLRISVDGTQYYLPLVNQNT